MSKVVYRRIVATTSIAFALIVILVTSLLMFSQSYNNTTAIIHSVIGFVFLASAFWHLFNNFTSIKKYLNPVGLLKKSDKYGLAPQISIVVMSLILILSWIEFTPMQRFHQWGIQLRINDRFEGRPPDSINYQVVGDYNNSQISVELKKGPAMRWPQYAIWLESVEGEFIQPLYVSQSVATNRFDNTVEKIDSSGQLNSNVLDYSDEEFFSIFSERKSDGKAPDRFRQESLPVFLHKLKGDKDSDRFLSPGEIAELDAYTGATLADNFMVGRSLKNSSHRLVDVYLEVNQSFDFNEYYSSDRFPDDLIYSGNGFSAQPSVIYRARVDLSKAETVTVMELVGHGHHSGNDGVIYKDVSNLTTALDIVDRVLVEVSG
ncbi:hypothetical protein QWI17_02225 [Gilvimarinus sp. SDUM040013]|uniref:DUF4405 domain-containing protein n=1 Tax=Gilvimarinus gilvus TaxID=3058038 RepID=A0ABU4S011_9GAMM|nr:hypothetical protein [Gilvimarinus sp. SDUM040013]MDO3384648.1 hypothetical protein [Gilvimarinus sp. SDUM040013]MDX6850234.1 hypothetical protein [Gilvimarinus sp. SDUM040013]